MHNTMPDRLDGMAINLFDDPTDGIIVGANGRMQGLRACRAFDCGRCGSSNPSDGP
jgi:hypothetical protein